jgi:hypothetical protein
MLEEFVRRDRDGEGECEAKYIEREGRKMGAF